MLGLEQEHGHLIAPDLAIGAITERVGEAASRDVLAGELLDPVGEPHAGRAGDVLEDAGAGRRRVERAMLALEEKDGHLGPGHRVVASEVAVAVAGGDTRSTGAWARCPDPGQEKHQQKSSRQEDP